MSTAAAPAMQTCQAGSAAAGQPQHCRLLLLLLVLVLVLLYLPTASATAAARTAAAVQHQLPSSFSCSHAAIHLSAKQPTLQSPLQATPLLSAMRNAEKSLERTRVIAGSASQLRKLPSQVLISAVWGRRRTHSGPQATERHGRPLGSELSYSCSLSCHDQREP